MARALWTGTISFGLVTIPVGLHSAVESREELSFHLLHKKDESRIEYKRFCSAEDVEVPWAEIVKGYEYEKGQVVVADRRGLRQGPRGGHAHIRHPGLRPRQGHRLYLLRPSILPGPVGKGRRPRPYALLRDALEKSGRVGIGTIVLRQREHLAALEPAGKALALTTMRFAHEIRPPRQAGAPQGGALRARTSWRSPTS